MKLFRLRESVRGSLWFIPGLCVIGAILLGFLLTYVDHRVEELQFAFGGGPDSARGFLSTIAASMITFTGLVFTITIVVLQLASQQFSPRVLRTFLRDRHSQVALGVFTATFTYALVVLREVRGEDGLNGPFVPALAVTASFLLVMLSLALFVHYINHIAQSIRVGSITKAVADETRRAIADVHDDEQVTDARPLPSALDTETILSPRRGVLQALDRERLTHHAYENDVVVEVVPAIGDFVPEGSILMRIHGRAKISSDHLISAVAMGTERTMAQDPAFGFRQLVDIAQRALSPSTNDPTTAVQCIDEIHDLLRRLGTRPFPTGQRLDESGKLRLSYPVTPWEAYVSLACDEIRHYGQGSIQIHRRLRSMLLDIIEIVPDERRDPLAKQLELLDDAAEKHLDTEHDVRAAKEPDEQGVGGA